MKAIHIYNKSLNREARAERKADNDYASYYKRSYKLASRLVNEYASAPIRVVNERKAKRLIKG